MQVRDAQCLTDDERYIMTTYAQLPPEKKRMFLDFILFLNEVCDNEKDPTPGATEEGSKDLAEGH